jgi:hypothetical protein
MIKFENVKFPLKLVGDNEEESYLVDQKGRLMIVATEAGEDHYKFLKWIAEKSQECEIDKN